LAYIILAFAKFMQVYPGNKTKFMSDGCLWNKPFPILMLISNQKPIS